jgi:hypothetical protein
VGRRGLLAPAFGLLALLASCNTFDDPVPEFAGPPNGFSPGFATPPGPPFAGFGGSPGFAAGFGGFSGFSGFGGFGGAGASEAGSGGGGWTLPDGGVPPQVYDAGSDDGGSDDAGN